MAEELHSCRVRVRSDLDDGGTRPIVVRAPSESAARTRGFERGSWPDWVDNASDLEVHPVESVDEAGRGEGDERG